MGLVNNRVYYWGVFKLAFKPVPEVVVGVGVVGGVGAGAGGVGVVDGGPGGDGGTPAGVLVGGGGEFLGGYGGEEEDGGGGLHVESIGVTTGGQGGAGEEDDFSQDGAFVECIVSYACHQIGRAHV